IRDLNLAKGIRESLKCKVSFAFNHEKALSRLAKAKNFKVTRLPIAQNFDLIIADSPYLRKSDFRKIRGKTKILLVISEGGRNLPLEADILLIPNLNNIRLNGAYKNLKYLSGRQYLLLGKEFMDLAGKKKIINRDVKKVFICFGGSDPGNISKKAINILKKYDGLSNLKVTLTLGHANIKTPYFKKANLRQYNIELRIGITDVAKYLFDADLAIISGGTLMYEACALGIPSIIISQNKDQEKEAKFLEKSGAVFNLGPHQYLTEKSFLDLFSLALEDFEVRKKLSIKCKKLIDPFGVNRVVKKIAAKIGGL
ncbi:MAG: hypothetical protein NT033_01460, partial [Candidatus Omnitrophica bacterium]|nr:hypothetical protein [Candidatus Omnitrophota bacterium]